MRTMTNPEEFFKIQMDLNREEFLAKAAAGTFPLRGMINSFGFYAKTELAQQMIDWIKESEENNESE